MLMIEYVCVVSHGRSPAMTKLYAVTDVCRRLGWSPSDKRMYQRVHAAICVGHAGQVANVVLEVPANATEEEVRACGETLGNLLQDEEWESEPTPFEGEVVPDEKLVICNDEDPAEVAAEGQVISLVLRRNRAGKLAAGYPRPKKQ
jgi:hypothetical protein